MVAKELPLWLTQPVPGDERPAFDLLHGCIALAASFEQDVRPLDSKGLSPAGVVQHALYGIFVLCIRLAYSTYLLQGRLETLLPVRALLEAWTSAKFILADAAKAQERAANFQEFFFVALPRALDDVPEAWLNEDERLRFSLLDQSRDQLAARFQVKRKCKGCKTSQPIGWDWDAETGSAKGKLSVVTKATESHAAPADAEAIIYTLYREASALVHVDILASTRVTTSLAQHGDRIHVPSAHARIFAGASLVVAWILLDLVSALAAQVEGATPPDELGKLREQLDQLIGPERARDLSSRGLASIQSRLAGSHLEQRDQSRYLISPDGTRLVLVAAVGYEYFVGSTDTGGFRGNRIGFSAVDDAVAEAFLRGTAIGSLGLRKYPQDEAREGVGA